MDLHLFFVFGICVTINIIVGFRCMLRKDVACENQCCCNQKFHVTYQLNSTDNVYLNFPNFKFDEKVDIDTNANITCELTFR